MIKMYRIAKLACTIYERDWNNGLYWSTAQDEAEDILNNTNCLCFAENGYPLDKCSKCDKSPLKEPHG